MKYSTIYAIFLAVVPVVSFCFSYGFLKGIEFEKRKKERLESEQIAAIMESIIERENENLALKRNATPIKGAAKLVENLITREN